MSHSGLSAITMTTLSERGTRRAVHPAASLWAHARRLMDGDSLFAVSTHAPVRMLCHHPTAQLGSAHATKNTFSLSHTPGS